MKRKNPYKHDPSLHYDSVSQLEKDQQFIQYDGSLIDLIGYTWNAVSPTDGFTMKRKIDATHNQIYLKVTTEKIIEFACFYSRTDLYKVMLQDLQDVAQKLDEPTWLSNLYSKNWKFAARDELPTNSEDPFTLMYVHHLKTQHPAWLHDFDEQIIEDANLLIDKGFDSLLWLVIQDDMGATYWGEWVSRFPTIKVTSERQVQLYNPDMSIIPIEN